MSTRTLLLATLLLAAGCRTLEPSAPAPTPPVIQEPVGEVPLEEQILHELNRARMDPAGYADLMELRVEAYDGKEGKDAIVECIDDLRKTSPMRPLTLSPHISYAARDHVMDQGFSGRIGHEGSDGSDPFSRIDRYVQTKGSAENISYGIFDARDIVMELLIDDGVPDRGHRINILNPNYEFVGIATGPHQRYRHMCVMDFTYAYEAW